jgi:hypothetical protein
MRRGDWPEKLADYFDARRDLPFNWQTNDCATFAAGAIEAMTGQAPALPAYKGAAGAARVMDEGSVRERCEALFGAVLPVAFAQRGDLVLMLMEGRETLGICEGDYIAGPGEAGMLFLPRAAGVCAWRV